MASVMGICGGLVEPKSENVEKVRVFKAFFEGQSGHGGESSASVGLARYSDMFGEEDSWSGEEE